MKTSRTNRKTAGIGLSFLFVLCLVLAAVSPAFAGAENPSLAFRIVDNQVQIGTAATTPYYLQWCTPMGEWTNWNESTLIDPNVPSLWFRGLFENGQVEDSMEWNPPEDVLLYSVDANTKDSDGMAWASIGKLNAEGLIQGIPAPDPMSFAASPDPVAYADPKVNQAVATPDPGRVKLYWQNQTTRQPIIWHLGDSGVRKAGVTVATSNPSSAWGIVGTADINGDGVKDLIWHNSSTGRLIVWFLDPDGVLNHTQQVVDANLSTSWKVKGVEDLNRDGVPDLIFHHATTGRAHIWFLNNTGQYVSGSDVADVNLVTAWQIKGVADMNHDANPDLIWHNTSTGRAHIWFLNATGGYLSGTNVANVNLVTAWQIKGVADMNHDTNPDLVWHHATTGRAHIWYLNATGNYLSGTNVADSNLATTWKIKGVADVNNDTNPDLIWHNSSSGRAHVWFLNGTGQYVSGTNALSVNLATTWQIDSVSY